MSGGASSRLRPVFSDLVSLAYSELRRDTRGFELRALKWDLALAALLLAGCTWLMDFLGRIVSANKVWHPLEILVPLFFSALVSGLIQRNISAAYGKRIEDHTWKQAQRLSLLNPLVAYLQAKLVVRSSLTRSIGFQPQLPTSRFWTTSPVTPDEILRFLASKYYAECRKQHLAPLPPRIFARLYMNTIVTLVVLLTVIAALVLAFMVIESGPNGKSELLYKAFHYLVWPLAISFMTLIACLFQSELTGSCLRRSLLRLFIRWEEQGRLTGVLADLAAAGRAKPTAPPPPGVVPTAPSPAELLAKRE